LTSPNIIRGFAGANVVSETDVRTRIAVPLFQHLGYSDSQKAEEFPIYGHAGGTPLPAKHADILYFNSDEHHLHRKRQHRDWVSDHTLLVVELKNPSEPMEEAQGQAQYYALWARVPIYVITNGRELAVYRLQSNLKDELELSASMEELTQQWARLERLLRPDAILRYCAQNSLKVDGLRATNYADYLKASFLDLQSQLDYALSRTVSDQITARTFNFPITLSGKVGGESWNSAPQTHLLEGNSSAVVLAEPGGGKTYLLKMLARDAIRTHEDNPEAPIPVILPARLWNRTFDSVIEGVHKELELSLPHVTRAIVDDDLRSGRFLLLVDGLDEAQPVERASLYYELLQIVRRSASRVIATCREPNYHDELQEQFGKCTIDLLVNEQIEKYAEEALAEVRGGGHFIYRIGQDLADLVRNPLFLFMTTEVLKTQPNAQLPNNRAALYADYTTLLLTEWERRRPSVRPFVVDQATKERILAEYAQRSWRQVPDQMVFNEVIQTHAGMWDPQVIRAELMRSGLLRHQQTGPEFYHPSFQEYFIAVGASQQSEERLENFIQEHHADEAYLEVFAYLAGLLQEEQRQALLFDYLEMHNLYLYRRCLGTRFDVPGEVLGAHWSERFLRTSLSQIRTSYLRLLEAHFGGLRALFIPWRGIVGPESSRELDLDIRGNLQINPKFSYGLRPTLASSPDTPRVCVGPMEWDEPYIIQASASLRGGINSARDVAMREVKRSLKWIIDKKKLPLADNHVLGCEWVENELRRFSFSRATPPQLRNLSLRRTIIDDIIAALELFPNTGAFGRYREGAPGLIEIKVDIRRMLSYLRRLREQGLDPEAFLLPPPDVDPEHVAESRRGYMWRYYSDEQLQARVATFHDYFQQAYRWIVEHHFPTLKEQMYLYRIGPIQFDAVIYIDKSERSGVQPWAVRDHVSVAWKPVPEGDDYSTITHVTLEEPKNLLEDVSQTLRQIESELGSLGRLSDLVSRQLRMGGYGRIEDYFVPNALNREVYRQLEQDLIRDLLGDFMGRIP
jgi:hypothetical protein